MRYYLRLPTKSCGPFAVYEAQQPFSRKGFSVLIRAEVNTANNSVIMADINKILVSKFIERKNLHFNLHSFTSYFPLRSTMDLTSDQVINF